VRQAWVFLFLTALTGFLYAFQVSAVPNLNSSVNESKPDPAVAQAAPVVPAMLLSGLEPLVIGEGSLFVNIGERTNVTGSRPSRA